MTVWVTPEALAAWQPPHTGRRGRPRDDADLAIETGHLLRLAFGQAWRQTEGLLRSLVTLLGLDAGVPDHTTVSRRSPGLVLAASLAQAQASGPVHGGDRRDGPEGLRRRRVAGRKARRARHPDMAQVAPSARPQQRRAPRLRADEQRGRRRFPSRCLARADPRPPRLGNGGRRLRRRTHPPSRGRAPARPAVAVVIPPRSTAVPSPAAGTAPSQRDQHIQMIGDKGRMGWQRAVGYGRRSHAETAMFRYKAIIGGSLRARTLPARRPRAGPHARCWTG